MKSYGRTSIYEFLGDWVVYRNLVPFDTRLPSLKEVRERLGIPTGFIPRKSKPEYADVLAYILQQARMLEAPDVVLRRLIYLGDTRMNDGAAFTNICRASGWNGLAFIASETESPKHVEVIEQAEGAVYLANRWRAIYEFDNFRREKGFPLDEQTTVIVDLDKTALGGRGRNDHVIDSARVDAVRRTVGDLLGNTFDPAEFLVAYDCLNQPEFHPFTADNQDYLAYICLILSAGLVDLNSLISELRAGNKKSFEQFIAEVDDRAAELPANLRRIHNDVYTLVQHGDPTPFKDFRYHEYQTTIGRMGWLDDSAPVSEMLQKEIVITQEVREIALTWREQGVLLFGLSDKPDEASIPGDVLAAQGYRAIHQVETHAVGG